MKKNKVINLLVEISYILLNLCLMVFATKEYYTLTSSDYYIFVSVIVIFVTVHIALGPLFGKIAGFPLSFLYYGYLSAQQNYFRMNQRYFRFSLYMIVDNLKFKYIIIAAVLFTVYLFVYFLTEREKEKNGWVRVFTLSLLSVVVMLTSIVHNKVINEKYYYGYILNNQPYYAYVHPENSADFVENYGLLTFLYRDLASIQKRNGKEVKEITQYFNSKAEVNPVDYDGILKDKNVLFIQAKEISDKTISAEETPMLYKLMNEGIYVNRFRTPNLFGKTGDSEFMANTSLIPMGYDEETIYSYDNNTYPTTLAKTFANSGYFTYLFYNDYSIYYNREKLSEKYGYDEFYSLGRFGISEAENDEEMAARITDLLYWGSDRYMGYWIANDYNDISELDRAVETIYNYLFAYDEETGEVSNDNVIVIIPDGTSEVSAYSGMIIYDGQHNFKISKYSSLIDLLPTSASLFGLSYNNKQTLGSNIFDPQYQGFSFYLSNTEYENWFCDLGRYDYKMHKVRKVEEGHSEEEVKELMEGYARLVSISHAILRNDYFAYEH